MGTSLMTPRARKAPTVDRLATMPSGRRVTAIERAVHRTMSMPPLRPPEPAHGPSLSAIWSAFEEDDLWACTYCDSSLGGKVVGEVDHVVPMSAGGLHILSNMVPSCRTCNRGKSDRPVQVWLAEHAGQYDRHTT
jgi:hypothetical protein